MFFNSLKTIPGTRWIKSAAWRKQRRNPQHIEINKPKQQMFHKNDPLFLHFFFKQKNLYIKLTPAQNIPIPLRLKLP